MYGELRRICRTSKYVRRKHPDKNNKPQNLPGEERLVIRLRVTGLLRMAGQQIVEAEGRKEAGSIPRTALRFGGIEFPNKCTKKMLGENSLS